MRQRPWDLSDYEISLMNSLAPFPLSSLPEHSNYKASHHAWKCGYQEEERQKSEAEGRFWISDKLLHATCRGVLSVPGESVLLNTPYSFVVSFINFFFFLLIRFLGISRWVFYLSICYVNSYYRLVRQTAGSYLKGLVIFMLNPGKLSLGAFRGCGSYLQKMWAGGKLRLEHIRCEYSLIYFVPSLTIVLSLSFSLLCFWFYFVSSLDILIQRERD